MVRAGCPPTSSDTTRCDVSKHTNRNEYAPTSTEVAAVKSISIQFHATPVELRGLVYQWLSTHNLYCAAIAYQPYEVVVVDRNSVCDAMESARRIVFGQRPLVLHVKSNNELVDRNPGLLILEAGRLDSSGLHESHLSTKESSPVWASIARALRKATRAGATALNESTGAIGPARAHRYTEGARNWWKAGTRMLTAGSAVMQLDDDQVTRVVK